MIIKSVAYYVIRTHAVLPVQLYNQPLKRHTSHAGNAVIACSNIIRQTELGMGYYVAMRARIFCKCALWFAAPHFSRSYA